MLAAQEDWAGGSVRDHSEPLLWDSHTRLNENAEAIPRAASAKRLREAGQRFVALYETWPAAEPDADLESTGGTPVPQKADAWRAKLGVSRAATESAATRPSLQAT